ncbi:MAG: class I SAM-dependent methyltransferase [Akkermansiaceae bacterium]
MSDLYKPVSKYYDLLSRVYSLGAIPRCRRAFVGEMGDVAEAEGRDLGGGSVSVCFVGVGHGEEAILAAEAGVMVTVVDISGSMLERFMGRLAGVTDVVRARVTVVHDDVRNMDGVFDWVVVNFFLNVFEEGEMLGMLDYLLERCGDGGSLVVGDFYYDAGGNVLVRGLQVLNWNLALLVFRVFVKNARHGIYAYEPHLKERGWVVKGGEKYGFLRILGVSFYQSVRFVRGSS